MVDEKPNKYEQHETLPIPTYDEAINSRPSSSQSFLGPQEVSHDAEREGLLARRQDHGYQTPMVESARSSLDLLPSSGEISRTASTEELRREILQMDVIEPGVGGDHRRHLLGGNRFSKRITSLTHSLSSLNLPFRQLLPSWDYMKGRVPSFLQGLKLNWILISRFFAIILVVFLAYLLFVSDLFKVGNRRGRPLFDPESIRTFVQDHINETSIREYSRYLTSFDHMAGTTGGLTQAQFLENIFAKSLLEDVGLERFDVYLNFPKDGGRRVAIIEPQELVWEAILEENPVYDDGRKQVPVFHGHSRSGNVTGPLIRQIDMLTSFLYVNFGSREDFKHLENKGINMTGSIALVRYYGSATDPAQKVRAAELAGAIGCVIYGDPAEDGFLHGPVYPEGRYMPQDGVQRGSVAMTSWIVGDPLSPGWASLPEEQRRDSKENNPALNNIPSIPLAWRDAQKLLQALKGHGVRLDDGWGKGGVPEVEWWSGDQTSPIVHLRNEQDEVERRPIYNVLGTITGIEQPEKSIIVGNHYDAWCFGAGDPSSGTAVLLEVVRIFGELRKAGWRPLRSIEFAAWDGEEYNLIGSTEHVEARMDDIRRNGFAYLNIDMAVIGTEFEASASPILSTALLHVLERVLDPVSNKTLRSIWAEKGSSVHGLGAGTDYVAFQDMAGTSSMDISFTGPPYPYHSCYDNFDWMDNFGDPGFQYHKAIAQIWALLILDLSSRELLPFDFKAYATEVAGYVDNLGKYAQLKGKALNLTPLHNAADEFTANAREFHQWNQAWSNLVYGEGGGFESNTMAIKRMSHNTRMANFETNLLDIDGGLPEREQYKHVIIAPQAWNGYDAAYFPGVRDAIDNGNWELAQAQVEKAARILSHASRKLNH